MADCADILRQLNAAKAALEALNTSGIIRSITDTDGSRIEYSVQRPQNLTSYVALLQAQYDACIAGTATIVTKPVNFFF